MNIWVPHIYKYSFYILEKILSFFLRKNACQVEKVLEKYDKEEFN